MTDFGSWLQDNWYDLGTLLTLMAFVAASVWFARNMLQTIRAFQNQIGTLLKLSLANSAKRPVKSPSAKEALAEGISSWLEMPAIRPSEHEETGPHRFALAVSRLFAWLQGPMHAVGAAPRRMVRWLQSPIGG